MKRPIRKFLDVIDVFALDVIDVFALTLRLTKGDEIEKQSMPHTKKIIVPITAMLVDLQ